jgi:hypothetical protein
MLAAVTQCGERTVVRTCQANRRRTAFPTCCQTEHVISDSEANHLVCYAVCHTPVVAVHTLPMA